MKNKINDKVIFYIVFCCLFVGVLIFSSDILLALDGGTDPVLSSIDLEAFLQDPIIFHLNKSEPKNDLLQKYRIEPSVFAESDHDNPEKEMRLFFKGVEHGKMYEVTTGVKGDRLLGFKEKNYRVNGQMNAFYAEFSPIKMKDDYYRMYIYCYENEYNHGVYLADQVYQKNGKGFSTAYYPSREVEGLKIRLGNNYTAHKVESGQLIEDEGLVAIQGYALSFDQKTPSVGPRYLAIENVAGEVRVFSTLDRYRRDLAAKYGPQYWNAGFIAYIPADFVSAYAPEINGGEIKIKIITQTEQGALYPEWSTILPYEML